MSLPILSLRLIAWTIPARTHNSVRKPDLLLCYSVPRFCIDQMRGVHGQGLLLSAESYLLLHTPQGNTGFAALGWGYLPSAFERRGPALFHAGSDGNWTAVVMLFPDTGNGVLVASNAFESMRGDRAANGAMHAIVPLIAEAATE
jgi:hypothetical protein